MLIDPLLLVVRTFGLHLHTLDVRQHANVHRKALEEASAWCAQKGSDTPGPLSPQTRDVLETMFKLAPSDEQWNVGGRDEAAERLRDLRPRDAA